MAPIATKIWHSLISRHATALSKALRKGVSALEAQLQGGTRGTLEPILIRNTPKQPLHPLARIRQGQSRWYSTARRSLDTTIRQFSSASGKSGPRHDRASFPKSAVGSHIRSSSGRAPFASTLRPNLTGGTLGRTAGGYSLGSGRVGGARYFSHGPAVQANVVQNVSQAVRAFVTSGQKARFDGVSANGNKRFKAVSSSQDETARKVRDLPKATPGSRIEFAVNPTITAFTCLNSVPGYSDSTSEGAHVNSNGLLDVLSADFSRSLKDLAAVLNDLKHLSTLGDLSITYETSRLIVHFPGCDAGLVERLCEDLNVQRGIVIQDEDFDTFVGTEIALLFPFAPSNKTTLTEESACSELFEYPAKRMMASQRHVISLSDMLSERSAYSSEMDHDFEDILREPNPWHSSQSGYHSVQSGSAHESDHYSPLEYQGFEGIYKFIQTLDEVRR